MTLKFLLFVYVVHKCNRVGRADPCTLQAGIDLDVRCDGDRTRSCDCINEGSTVDCRDQSVLHQLPYSIGWLFVERQDRCFGACHPSGQFTSEASDVGVVPALDALPGPDFVVQDTVDTDRIQGCDVGDRARS